jgi:hypothetical protein
MDFSPHPFYILLLLVSQSQKHIFPIFSLVNPGCPSRPDRFNVVLPLILSPFWTEIPWRIPSIEIFSLEATMFESLASPSAARDNPRHAQLPVPLARAVPPDQDTVARS